MYGRSIALVTIALLTFSSLSVCAREGSGLLATEADRQAYAIGVAAGEKVKNKTDALNIASIKELGFSHGLTTDIERQAYGAGLAAGMETKKAIEIVRASGVELNVEMVKLGFSHGLSGEYITTIKENADDMMGVYELILKSSEEPIVRERIRLKIEEEQAFQDLMKKTLRDVENEALRPIDKESFFLSSFKEADGTRTTSSGLLYHVLKEGKGDLPGPDDVIYYATEMTPIEGLERHDGPLAVQSERPLSDVNVKFMRDAFSLMREGSVVRFVIPSYVWVPDNFVLVYNDWPVDKSKALVATVQMLKIKRVSAKK